MAVTVVILNLIYARLNGSQVEKVEEDAKLFTQPNNLASWLHWSSIIIIGDW
jgi:hypothetical protein